MINDIKDCALLVFHREIEGCKSNLKTSVSFLKKKYFCQLESNGLCKLYILQTYFAVSYMCPYIWREMGLYYIGVYHQKYITVRTGVTLSYRLLAKWVWLNKLAFYQ